MTPTSPNPPRLSGTRWKRLAKGAGVVVLGLIALDIVATLLTVAVGAKILRP